MNAVNMELIVNNYNKEHVDLEFMKFIITIMKKQKRKKKKNIITKIYMKKEKEMMMITTTMMIIIKKITNIKDLIIIKIVIGKLMKIIQVAVILIQTLKTHHMEMNYHQYIKHRKNI